MAEAVSEGLRVVCGQAHHPISHAYGQMSAQARAACNNTLSIALAHVVSIVTLHRPYLRSAELRAKNGTFEVPEDAKGRQVMLYKPRIALLSRQKRCMGCTA